MQYIKYWSDFILDETLKTTEINYSVEDIFDELSLSGIKCKLEKENNNIKLIIYNFNTLDVINIMFDYINSLIIDRHGWFPSKIRIVKLNDTQNTIKYDQEYVIENKNDIKEIIITYEAKFGITTDIPKKLYHLSIKEYKDSILKYGLVPKSKNKKSIHLDRIYFCKNVNDCKLLIYDMKYDYEKIKQENPKNTINIEWIIFEINTDDLHINLYKDPSFNNKGYYCINNIPPKYITVYEEEKINK